MSLFTPLINSRNPREYLENMGCYTADGRNMREPLSHIATLNLWQLLKEWRRQKQIQRSVDRMTDMARAWNAMNGRNR